MKYFTTTFFVVLTAVILNQACSQKSDLENEGMNMVKDFYTLYIAENAKDQPDEDLIEELKNENCTKDFLDRLKEEELDADPFLNVQDFKEEWIKSLTVVRAEDKGYAYKVCFEEEQKKHCVIVHAYKKNNAWKIESVYW